MAGGHHGLFAGFGWFLCTFPVPSRLWGRNPVHSDLSGGGASVFWHVMGQSEMSQLPPRKEGHLGKKDKEDKQTDRIYLLLIDQPV